MAAEPAPPPPASSTALEAPAPVWTATTYFAQGYPYTIVINLADLFFIAHGASNKEVGLTSLFHVPWNFKWAVGPFFDEYATKRAWLVGIELLLSIVLVAFAFFAATFSSVLLLASVLFLTLAILSAMHDIAIDGLYLEALDKTQQEALVGVRAPAWRFAAFVGFGPIVVVADKLGWPVALTVLAVGMIGLFAFHWFLLPRAEVYKKSWLDLVRRLVTLRFLIIAAAVSLFVLGVREVLGSQVVYRIGLTLDRSMPKLGAQLDKLGAAEWIGLTLFVLLITFGALLPKLIGKIEGSTSTYGKSFVAFLAQPFALRILLYVVLFRIGESFLMKMKAPFIVKTLHFTQAEYGVINGGIGMVLGLIAPLAGGLLIAKFGLKRCLWPFLLAQNGLHLVFAAAALYTTEIMNATSPVFSVMVGMQQATVVDVRIVIVTLVICIEIIGAGLGTAAFMVYLIRSCLPEHKAAHMALLTSLMSVSFTLAGVFSGFLADWMGFALYFAFTFVVTIPGMLLTLWVPHIAERGSPPRFA